MNPLHTISTNEIDDFITNEPLNQSYMRAKHLSPPLKPAMQVIYF